MKHITKLLIFIFVFAVFMLLPGCSGNKAGIMIYEVYTSGGYSSGESYAPYLNSYVVLYNSKDEAVDLSGWSLRYCKSGNTKIESAMTVSLTGSIESRQFYVISGGTAPDAPDNPVGEPIPFKIDFNAVNFQPDRKAGVIALCDETAGDNKSFKASSSFVESYFSYSNKNENEEDASGIGVKKIYRRSGFTDYSSSKADFETKNIVDKPYHIIHYTKGMTSREVSEYLMLKAPSIQFSHEPGQYNKEFKLELSADFDDSYKIYYTLDGSPPVTPLGIAAPGAVEYKNPIRIYDRTGETTNLMDVTGLQPSSYDDPKTAWPPLKLQGESESAYRTRLNNLYKSVYKVNVVRAAAVSDKGVVTPTVSNSFFVTKKKFTDRFNTPVLSIMIDKKELFDKKLGIFMYDNIENRAIDSRRPALLQFFEKDGKLAFQESFSFSLQGGYTRVFPQKSIRINMSNDKFDYDVFNGAAKDSADKTITYFDKLILRSGGNDWYGGAIRDVFWQNYCSQLGSFDSQANRPCVVFINGEYWGLYSLMERMDEFYFASHYGIPKEDIAIAESFFALSAGSYTDIDPLIELRGFMIGNDMSKSENYKRFTDMIDVDSYIDYFICELYSGNTDWPHNNLRSWRNNNEKVEDHQKWRMIFWDIDFGFNVVHSPETDPLNWIMNEADMENAKMFKAVMGNPEFKTKFIKRFEDLLETFFVKEKMVKYLSELRKQYETATPEHRARWNMDMESWNGTFNYIENYISIRNGTIRKAIDKIK